MKKIVKAKCTELQLKSQKNKISKSVFLSFAMIGESMEDGHNFKLINSTINSIFKDVDEIHILNAIKEGNTGAYGQTYRMSPQVVCIWIRKYIKDNGIIIQPTTHNINLNQWY